MALRIGLLEGRRGSHLLMSEVPLYHTAGVEGICGSAGHGALVLCIKPTSSLPVLQIPKSITLSVASPTCHYRIAYSRTCQLSTSFTNLGSPR